MRIAIDATALYGRYNGVEYALWNLLAALRVVDTENSYTVYVPQDGPPAQQIKDFDSRWDWVRLPFSGGEKARRILWQQSVLPRLLTQAGCDILHAPTYVMPLRSPVPTVLTVHDLIALTHPEYATKLNRLHYGLALQRSLERAERIIVMSQAVQRAVAKASPAAAAKTTVVPLGVEPCFFQAPDEAAIAEASALYNLPPRFLLFVGNFEPKKNLERLLQAHARLPEAPPLVLAGGARAWDSNGIQDSLGSGRAQAIGYVRRRDLPVLYSQCEAFVFPSLAEGFGLPVLEALACGAAVVTSSAVPLPNLEEAALVCNPRDIDSIAANLQLVLSDEDRRQDLKTRAARYAQPFTWKATAEGTLAVYNTLA